MANHRDKSGLHKLRRRVRSHGATGTPDLLLRLVVESRVPSTTSLPPPAGSAKHILFCVFDGEQPRMFWGGSEIYVGS
jgi:hypothetical protein